MRKKQTSAQSIRARILRVFAVERRWLCYHMISEHDFMLKFDAPAGLLIAEGVHDLFERGRLIGSYDNGPVCKSWWYLWTALLPSRELLAARVSSCEEGMQCRARNWN